MASDITANELALRVGLTRRYRRAGWSRIGGDGVSALRDLGLRERSDACLRTHLPEEVALRYARALHLDPLDIGL
jgi:hypothetical protein